MTDYRTEQSAAQLWRDIDARIDRKIAAAAKAQTGIVPNTAYSSIKFDASGRAVWGNVAASTTTRVLLGEVEIALTSVNETDTDGTGIRYSPAGLLGLDGGDVFFVVPPGGDGVYRFEGMGRIGDTIRSWDAGDEYRVKLYVNTVDTVTMFEQVFGNNTGVGTSFFVQGFEELTLAAADVVTFVHQNASQNNEARSVQFVIWIYGAPTLLSEGGGVSLGDQGSKHMTGASSTLAVTDGIDLKLDYNVADTDPYGQMGGLSFTAAIAMTVDVTANIATSGVGSWGGSDDLTLVVRKNNTTDSTIDSKAGPDTGDWALSGTATGITLAPGDYIEIFLLMNRGGVGDVDLDPTGATWSINRTA